MAPPGTEASQLDLMHHFNADNNDASVQLEWKQFQKKLDDAVSHLPPKRQLVFMLCREEKKTYGEVAMLLGISKNTVKEHMVLAMRTIAAFLKPNANIYVLFILLVLTK